MFGKLMSIDDPLMIKYDELLSNQDIQHITSLHPMEAKKILAGEIVERFYNKAISIAVRKDFEEVFSKRDSLPANMATYRVEDDKRWLPHVLTVSGVTKSNSEAMRLMKEGAVEIDGVRVTERNAELPVGREQIAKVGKKRFIKIIS